MWERADEERDDGRGKEDEMREIEYLEEHGAGSRHLRAKRGKYGERDCINKKKSDDGPLLHPEWRQSIHKGHGLQQTPLKHQLSSKLHLPEKEIYV